jgi:amino acid transporter
MKLLSTLQSAFIGLANTAPTYGIAVAGGALLIAAGARSPLMVLFCLLVILGIFYAGSRLNVLMPSYGSVYTWGRNVIHPFVGFIAGWFSVVALCLFLVYASVYAITLFFEALFPGVVLSQVTTVLCAAILIVVMVFISTRGISVTARFQNFFTAVELALLAFFALFFINALFHGGIVAGGDTRGFTLEAFTQSFLLAIFFFWGWEVVFNLSEDSEDKRVTPRKSGIVTLVLLAVIYIAYMWMFSLLIPEGGASDLTTLFDILNNGTFPHFTYVLAIIAVTISIVGAIDIAIVEGAKELIAQSRDKLSLQAFAKLDPKTGAPRHALIFVGLVALLGVLLSSYLPTVGAILAAGVTISTLLIACYYFLMPTVWLVHAARNWGEVKNILLDIAVPVASMLLFAFAIVATFISFDSFTQITFVGIVVLGSAVYIFFAKFYKTRTG